MPNKNLAAGRAKSAANRRKRKLSASSIKEYQRTISSLMDEAESFLFLLFAADSALAAVRFLFGIAKSERCVACAFRASAPLAPQEPRSSA